MGLLYSQCLFSSLAGRIRTDSNKVETKIFSIAGFSRFDPADHRGCLGLSLLIGSNDLEPGSTG